MIALNATVLTYTVEDASGYRFTVTCSHDRELGWNGSASFSSSGFTTPEAAIAKLVQSAREFVRIAETEVPDVPTRR